MRLNPPLSLALVELPVDVPAGSDLFRAQVTYAAKAGFRAVQLNAAAHGMRARELGRSERRDVASLLKRSEAGLSGADLWIPPEHFVDETRVDRAVNAVLAAVELVSDLDRLLGGGGDGRVVCVSLPKGVDESVVSAIAAKAADCGARVADFGPRVDEHEATGVVGRGFDPAASLLAGAEVMMEAGVMKLPRGVVGARFTDASALGRVVPGAAGGRLDVLAYGVALMMARYRGHVILDVRGLPDPLGAARRAREAWEGAATPVL